MVVFPFSVLNGKHLFWANLVQKIKIVSLSWNMVPIQINNLNMQNSMVVFTFSVWEWKHSFGVNLVEKFNIVSLRGNLVPRTNQIRRIYWRCSLFLFSTGNTILGKFWQNIVNIVSLSWSFVERLFQICRIIWWSGNTLFGQILGKSPILWV